MTNPTNPMHSDADDLEEDGGQETTAEGRPVVRHVVKDLNTALKMKKAQAAADADARKAQASAEADARKAEAQARITEVRAEERHRKQELQAEIARMKLTMSAGEKARAHIAVAGPFYLLILIGGFILMLATGSIPEDQVSVASALLTLLVTMIGANLRSIISESSAGADEANGNGHGHDDDDKPKPPSKEAPKRKVD